MPSGGAIINLSSSGTKIKQQYPAYICSKLGLEGITVSTAKTLAARGITINTISPGFT
jgi:3-oxoacyl-[acyl-carrier protein] reductase